jgi:FAD/FMN-containing dehydrogenase
MMMVMVLFVGAGAVAGEQQQAAVVPTPINNEEVNNEKTKKRNVVASHRKVNTGYNIKHLFIGLEGTLGIVTKEVRLRVSFNLHWH